MSFQSQFHFFGFCGQSSQGAPSAQARSARTVDPTSCSSPACSKDRMQYPSCNPYSGTPRRMCVTISRRRDPVFFPFLYSQSMSPSPTS